MDETSVEMIQEGVALAEAVGARCCVDIAGSFNPDSWFGPHPENLSERFFDAARHDWGVRVGELLDDEQDACPIVDESIADERLVILNRIARSVVNTQRGTHPTHVFHYRGKPISHMLTNAWKRGG